MKKRKGQKGAKGNKKMVNAFSTELNDALTKILDLTDLFCDTYLNEDYKELCEEMAFELCDYEVPINRGRPASWASGIVHALGWVNFLQDPAQSPYMNSAQIAEGFGVSQGTMLAKSRIIRDELDLIQLDPEWCLPALLEENPLVWMLQVNGFIMDIRFAPRELQEEAYRLGLIPFIPADRQKSGSKSNTGPKIIKFPSGQGKNSKPESIHRPKDDEPAEGVVD